MAVGQITITSDWVSHSQFKCPKFLGDLERIVFSFLFEMQSLNGLEAFLGLNLMDTQESKTRRRELSGKVVSNKSNKTVVVEVERRVLHPKYKKFVRKSAKYHAHDEDNSCGINDVVVIRESRPLSKLKRWVVVERRS